MKNKFSIIALMLCVVLALSGCGCGSSSPTQPATEKTDSQIYDEAVTLISKGQYEDAYYLLKDIEGFDKASELLKNFLVTEKECMTTNSGSTYTLETTTNSDGVVVKEELFDFDGSHTLCEYELGPDGVVIASKIDNDGYVSNWEYSYDENGNCIKEDGIDLDGNKGAYVYEYDEKNNCIKETYSDASGDVVKTFTYDENNNLIKEEYNAPFGIYYVIEDFYNADGKKVKTTWSDSSGSSWVSENIYDDNQNISQNILTEGDYVETTVFTYYADGKVKTATTSGADGEESVTEYSYETIITYTGN